MDWDDAFSNSAYIPDGESYPALWADVAARFRASHIRAQLDQPYGAAERERFDLFLPEGAPKGTVIFVHGGYWLDFDKSSWSHLAAGPLAHGWAVAMPSYTLCPQARIAEITGQIRRAVAAQASGPLILCGHSAGGHLVSRMGCTDGIDAQRIVSISGLHDLRPLLNTRMNDTLRLDAEEAARESPALLQPRRGVDVICWVGAEERPELRRQTALLADIWSGLGAKIRAHEEKGRHHFNVIADLADPHSALVAALLF